VREKNFNTGLRGVLFESRHYERMGQAIWLYGWLVLRQTRQTGTRGLVLGGRPVSYHEIEEETGFHSRTLERWMRVLRREGYIETHATPAGVVVQITKAKKFFKPSAWAAPEARGSAGAAPKSAETLPLCCGGVALEAERFQRAASGIDSGSVDDKKRSPITNYQKQEGGQEEERREMRALSIEKLRTVGETRDAGCPGPAQQFRQMRLLRAETREELVRRELQVGAGPEVQRRIS